MYPPDALIFRAADDSINAIASGNFAKKILVLALSEPDTPGNQAFIAKVLAAAQLDLAQDALFATINHGTPVNCFLGLPERPKYIFAFGLTPAQVGLTADVKPYQTLTLNNTTWLFGDALSILEPNRDKKGLLWNALKALFL